MHKIAQGAVWRKWDLHIHTPETLKNNQFGSGEDTWERYITALEANTDIGVIGITDYFSINNYKRIKEYQARGRLHNKVFFVNVELRVLPVTSTDQAINLHVIFDPDIPVDDIEREFFRKLKFSYSGREYTCTDSDIINLGKAFDGNTSIADDDARRKGIEQIVIPAADIKRLLKDSVTVLNGRFLVGVSNSSNDGASGIQHSSLCATRQEIYRAADFIFSSNPRDVDFFLGKGCNSEEQLIKAYGGLKPCFCGSDAHSFDKIHAFTENRFCWVKADPSFNGLKQVINEPEERVYIGSMPSLLTRTQSNRTKFIKGLSISKIDTYDGSQGKWFHNVFIPVNHELVAIIGNKGSGKSAVADIIALCAGYRNNPKEHTFSFLTDEKFLKHNGRIAKNFIAKLIWEDDSEIALNLSNNPDAANPLRVKYLPQSKFEQLTNEVASADKFQDEIQNVVFSHIPLAERLGAKTLGELIGTRTADIESKLQVVKVDIAHIVNRICNLEKKLNPEYKNSIEKLIEQKENELRALQSPTPVSNPSEDPAKQEQYRATSTRIEEIRKGIQELEIRINEEVKKEGELFTSIQSLKTIENLVNQKITDVESFKAKLKQDFPAIGLDFGKLLILSPNLSEVKELYTSKCHDLKSVQELLGTGTVAHSEHNLSEALSNKKALLNTEIAKLGKEQQTYQSYLQELKVYEDKKADIIGKPLIHNSLSFYQEQLKYVTSQLGADIDAAYVQLYALSELSFDIKQEVVQIYKTVKGKLTRIITENSKLLSNYRIDVDANFITKRDFSDRFTSYIDKSKKGTFYSKEGADDKFRQLVSQVNFDQKTDVINFLKSTIEYLKVDKRDGQNNENRNVEEQLNDFIGFYEYLFSLDFLENIYQLKQGDKTLQELSPGERGGLLLVFYLLLDNSDIPLIIDQPEDNLDNQSVANILVPFIKAAKTKRQIIMVTHNPNLAIVSDAEQVIYVSLNKEDGYLFTHESGSIENVEVNKKIVDVLEGAMPAFNTRKKKYYE